MRLIDADALGKRITKRLRKKGSFEGKDITELGYVILCIHEAETVDTERHGHWEYNPKDAFEVMYELPKCSVCGHESSDALNYCSNCGAKMDEEIEEDE